MPKHTELLHYRDAFYKGKKPYRNFLIQVMRKYGYDPLTSGEMWTLGGAESREYDYLCERGVSMPQEAYHSVDWGDFTRRVDGVVYHPKTRFNTIHEIWTEPRIIAFDSTNGLTPQSTCEWSDIVMLATKAVKRSGDVLLVSNFMGDWAGFSWGLAEKPLEVLRDWLSMAVDRFEWHGFKVDVHAKGLAAPKQDSRTTMVATAMRVSRI